MEISLQNYGAIAQLGERLNGIQEVVGSIPSGSTVFMYYVYILKSQQTGWYYIGHTQDLPKRIHQHNSGYSKSTKSGIPWELVHQKEFQDRGAAMKRELELKRKKSREFIEELIDANS